MNDIWSFMGTFGGFEWLIIILILLFLFGAKRIPEMARGIGRGIVEFRKASDMEDEKETRDRQTTASEQQPPANERPVSKREEETRRRPDPGTRSEPGEPTGR